jgi:hypothetical protein
MIDREPLKRSARSGRGITSLSSVASPAGPGPAGQQKACPAPQTDAPSASRNRQMGNPGIREIIAAFERETGKRVDLEEPSQSNIEAKASAVGDGQRPVRYEYGLPV